MTLPVPDLLCAQARVRVDVAALRQTLVFAFAAGAPQETFDDAIAGAVLPASTWQRSAFARDLYLDEVVEKCLAVRVGGRAHRACARYVARVVAAPPCDVADAGVRREALAEIASSPAARSDVERVYVAILKVRALLCAARQPAPRVRRVEILRASREAFELLAASFAGSGSALSRLRAFGAAVVASEGHRRLVAFLEHDDHLASLDLRVRVGADGEVRALEIVRVVENSTNPFHPPLLRRWVARLALLFRGFRTTSEEIAERLLLEVFGAIEHALALLFQLLGDIEVLLGAVGFRDRAIAAGLAAELPVLVSEDEALDIIGLYNPLLLASGIGPVPCDVHAGARAIVVVTGPNSGGKTRLLQALAMSQLFAQVGLFVPARSARIPIATGLFSSLFEEARADQPEGHLGMELLRIRRLFDELDAGAFVAIDELCSGTNPSEGEEIARLVLGLLPELGVRAFVTTHLLQFAAALAAEPSGDVSPDARPSRFAFLQVELDANERPTYRFTPGVARTSLAHKTAARLGVTREELLARIAAKRARRA